MTGLNYGGVLATHFTGSLVNDALIAPASNGGSDSCSGGATTPQPAPATGRWTALAVSPFGAAAINNVVTSTFYGITLDTVNLINKGIADS